MPTQVPLQSPRARGSKELLVFSPRKVKVERDSPQASRAKLTDAESCGYGYSDGNKYSMTNANGTCARRGKSGIVS